MGGMMVVSRKEGGTTVGFENRWYVTAWSSPPGERYRDIHPKHRDAYPGKYGCGIVEPVGRIESRTYKTKRGAETGARKMRGKFARMESVEVEITTGGEYVGEPIRL